MVTAARTVSQVGMHMSVAFAVMYAFTGSVALGGVAAVVEPICNVALLPLHDRAWEKIRARVEARGKNAGSGHCVTAGVGAHKRQSDQAFGTM